MREQVCRKCQLATCSCFSSLHDSSFLYRLPLVSFQPLNFSFLYLYININSYINAKLCYPLYTQTEQCPPITKHVFLGTQVAAWLKAAPSSSARHHYHEPTDLCPPPSNTLFSTEMNQNQSQQRASKVQDGAAPSDPPQTRAFAGIQGPATEPARQDDWNVLKIMFKLWSP